MKTQPEYILALEALLESMAADGYTFDDVEEIFYLAVDETGLFDDIEWEDEDDYEDT